MRKGNGKGGALWLTRSYSYVDKDPEIDVFRTLYEDERLKENDLAALAGVSVSTVKNMFGGKTKRPQHLTYSKLAGAMGCEYKLTKAHQVNYDKEIPEAKAQRRAYQMYLEKKRERRERETKRASK